MQSLYQPPTQNTNGFSHYMKAYQCFFFLENLCQRLQLVCGNVSTAGSKLRNYVAFHWLITLGCPASPPHCTPITAGWSCRGCRCHPTRSLAGWTILTRTHHQSFHSSLVSFSLQDRD